MTAAAAWRWMFTSPARYARLLCLRLGGRGRSWGCNTDCSELEPGGGVSLACTRREKLLFSFRLFGQIHYALDRRRGSMAPILGEVQRMFAQGK